MSRSWRIRWKQEKVRENREGEEENKEGTGWVRRQRYEQELVGTGGSRKK